MDRKLEILICLIGLVLAFPFLILTYVIVLFALGRPVFFRQRRAGRGGSTFDVVKFRSLTDERDENGDWLPDDQRLTKATNFLRRVRLDELPQLVIILMGKMALVGPRPLLPQTIEGFGAAGKLRCSIRPGLTGWSQVSGNTGLSDHEKLLLDLWYVEHRSTALDLSIMRETVGVALNGEKRRPDRLAAAAAWLKTRDDITLDTPDEDRP